MLPYLLNMGGFQPCDMAHKEQQTEFSYLALADYHVIGPVLQGKENTFTANL